MSIPSLLEQDRYGIMDYYQFNERNNKKPSDVMSVKSDKAFNKLLDKQSYHHQRPFQRKQEITNNGCNKKKQIDDVGKLIRGTSFCSSFNGQAQNLFESDNKRQNKLSPQQENKKFEKGNKNSKPSHFFDEQVILHKISSMKEFSECENIQKKNREQEKQQLQKILKIYEIQNEKLKKKITVLQAENKKLQLLFDNIVKNMNKMEKLVQEKENQIIQFNNELNRKIQENQCQKQINNCLEDVIERLNQRIESMLKKNQDEELYKKVRCNSSPDKQQLQFEVQELRESVFSMKRQLQSVEIQNIIMNKLRFELEKQKILKKQLESQNKCLKQRMMTMKKTIQNRLSKENWKTSLRKQLQYSISFSFDK